MVLESNIIQIGFCITSLRNPSPLQSYQYMNSIYVRLQGPSSNINILLEFKIFVILKINIEWKIDTNHNDTKSLCEQEIFFFFFFARAFYLRNQ